MLQKIIDSYSDCIPKQALSLILGLMESPAGQVFQRAK